MKNKRWLIKQIKKESPEVVKRLNCLCCTRWKYCVSDLSADCEAGIIDWLHQKVNK